MTVGLLQEQLAPVMHTLLNQTIPLPLSYQIATTYSSEVEDLPPPPVQSVPCSL